MTDLTIVDFQGASLVVQQGATPGLTMVAMRPVVEGMGLDWSAQFRKIQRNPVLSKGVAIMAIPSAGGMQEMVALPLSRLNFWLATVDADRIKDADTRARVLAYQEECADTLFKHFFGQRVLDASGRDAAHDESPMRKPMAQWTGRDMDRATNFLTALSKSKAYTPAEIRWFLTNHMGVPLPPHRGMSSQPDLFVVDGGKGEAS